MRKELLLGNEAIARGAIDAGISGVYAYPGTPSTEITEYIQKYANDVRSSWSANEKTAYESALGMSYAGKRALVCMKHVGLNVAADAFINSAIGGVNGGLVLAVADDPSMHSSQNEQDSRVYGRFAMIPVIEPATQQEAYMAVRHAFDLSEKTRLPVMLRITTRLSHSRAGVTPEQAIEQNKLYIEPDKTKFNLLPAIARKRYQALLDIQTGLEELSANSPLNGIVQQSSSGKGVIAFGIALNYVLEILQTYKLDLSVLKIGQYPLPNQLINNFFEKHEEVLLVEEGYPVYEELLNGYFGNKKIKGRLDGSLPRTGELNPDILAEALTNTTRPVAAMPDFLVNRPPGLCKGCSHSDLFVALNQALDSIADPRVFSDIGCYTLGALPPYNAIHTCVDMGASVTMAKGAADAGFRPAVAVIGDSTFTHSGMTGLLDCVNDKSAVTIIISDNNTTAMTGGQTASGTGKIYDICKGLGVDEIHIRTLVPLRKDQEAISALLKEELDYDGVSVVLACRECIQSVKRRKKQAATI